MRLRKSYVAIKNAVLAGKNAAMFRKLLDAIFGLAMMGMAETANAAPSDNGATT